LIDVVTFIKPFVCGLYVVPTAVAFLPDETGYLPPLHGPELVSEASEKAPNAPDIEQA